MPFPFVPVTPIIFAGQFSKIDDTLGQAGMGAYSDEVKRMVVSGGAKNINEAWLRVVSSSGIFIGPNANSLVEAKQRTTEPYGSPPSLKTDEIGVKLTPSWQQSGQIFVRQSDPLPLTIVGLTLEVSIGG